jgi:hypothetical protein
VKAKKEQTGGLFFPSKWSAQRAYAMLIVGLGNEGYRAQ